MDYKKRCPEIHYKLEHGGIEVTGCYGFETVVIVPPKINGRPVEKISPYGFSKRTEFDPDEFIDRTEESLFGETWKRLCTTEITEVHLPSTVKEIGSYAFYRCFRLKKLTLSDNLKEIGAGAFTGCRLRELEIDFYHGESSCLSSIADDIRYPLYVTLRYHRKNGETHTARLVFPEYYEEAVENTPARLLETRFHGSGGFYRQCFYNKEVHFKEYDSLFSHAVSQETDHILTDLVMSRLRFPFRLDTAARQMYEHWLCTQICQAAVLLANREDVAGLQFLSEKNYWTREGLEAGMTAASEAGKTAVLGMLMDESYKRFPRGKKVFEL